MPIPALQEILASRPASVGVDLLRRDDDGKWPDRPLAITIGAFPLSSIELRMPVAALYRGAGMA
jgi:hypothetical protein